MYRGRDMPLSIPPQLAPRKDEDSSAQKQITAEQQKGGCQKRQPPFTIIPIN